MSIRTAIAKQWLLRVVERLKCSLALPTLRQLQLQMSLLLLLPKFFM